jgi:hypothetical protein
MLRPAKNPAIRLLARIALPIQRRDVNQNEIGERVHIKEHVASAGAAKPTVTRRFGVEVLYLLLALSNRERISFDHCDDCQGAAARVCAIGTQTVMNLERLFRILIPNRVLFAATAADCRE